MPRHEKMFNLDVKPSLFENRVHRYFDTTDPPYSFGGLYVYLGIGKTKYHKLAKKDEYKDACDYANAMMQKQYEELLASNKPTGAIFGLKNMGWSDSARVDLNVEGVPVEQLLKGEKMKAK